MTASLLFYLYAVSRRIQQQEDSLLRRQKIPDIHFKCNAVLMYSLFSFSKNKFRQFFCFLVEKVLLTSQ